MHTPATTAVAIVPVPVSETVHTSGVAERNETGSLDEAVACRRDRRADHRVRRPGRCAVRLR